MPTTSRPPPAVGLRRLPAGRFTLLRCWAGRPRSPVPAGSGGTGHTLSATIASTVISPRVSKPWNPRAGMFTTLLLPPRQGHAGGRSPRCRGGRMHQHRIGEHRHAQPAGQRHDQATVLRRSRAPGAAAEWLAREATRGGAQRRPSKSSTVATGSTISWVSARSGADSHRKVTKGDDAGAANQRQRRQAAGTRPARPPPPLPRRRLSHRAANSGSKPGRGRLGRRGGTRRPAAADAHQRHDHEAAAGAAAAGRQNAPAVAGRVGEQQHRARRPGAVQRRTAAPSRARSLKPRTDGATAAHRRPGPPRHQQRNVEAVPHRQVVFRHRGPRVATAATCRIGSM